jgi:hypothetical protein
MWVAIPLYAQDDYIPTHFSQAALANEAINAGENAAPKGQIDLACF